MAIHSSILAWRIPWTEEPGRLQSMGSQSWTRLNFLSFLKVSCVFQYRYDRKSFTIWSKVSLEVRHLPSPKDCQSFLDDYILKKSFPGTCKRLFPVLKLQRDFLKEIYPLQMWQSISGVNALRKGRSGDQWSGRNLSGSRGALGYLNIWEHSIFEII